MLMQLIDHHRKPHYFHYYSIYTNNPLASALNLLLGSGQRNLVTANVHMLTHARYS